MHGSIIIAILLLILVHQHMQMRLIQSVADKLDVPKRSMMELLVGPKADAPMPIVAQVEAPATTSGFSNSSDFMSHARRMDARTGSPAAKTEALMMNNDRAQRKLRSALVKGG